MSRKKSPCKANEFLKQYGATFKNPANQPAITLLGYILKVDRTSQLVQNVMSADWKYGSYESLLLDSGKFYKVDSSKDCPRKDFENRFQYAAQQQDAQHVYVEGIVLKEDDMAVEHAWILNKETDEIHDDYFNGAAYFGIAFNQPFVDKWITSMGIFSLGKPASELLIYRLPANCFLTLNWIPPGGEINIRNGPTWTLQSPVNQNRRRGDETGGRLRTDTKSVSHRGTQHTRDQPPV